MLKNRSDNPTRRLKRGVLLRADACLQRGRRSSGIFDPDHAAPIEHHYCPAQFNPVQELAYNQHRLTIQGSVPTVFQAWLLSHTCIDSVQPLAAGVVKHMGFPGGNIQMDQFVRLDIGPAMHHHDYPFPAHFKQ